MLGLLGEQSKAMDLTTLVKHAAYSFGAQVAR